MNLDDPNRTPQGARIETRPSGSTANCGAGSIAELHSAIRLHRQLAAESIVDLEAALPVLKETLAHQSGQSAKVAAILESVWNGELCDHLAGLDTRIAQAVIAMIAARAHLAGDADEILRPLIPMNHEPGC